MAIEFLLNQERVRVEEPAGLLVLDWLRQRKSLTGTKEGCKEGDCGACSVMVGVLDEQGQVSYKPVTSCLMPLGELHGRHLLTIEGVNLPAGQLNPAQRAMVQRGGAQCGFCTPGFIVSMCWYLMQSPDASPSLEGFKHAISGNLCRCTGYGSIMRAGQDLAQEFGPGGELEAVWRSPDRVGALIERGLLPGYLAQIPARLAQLQAPTASAPAASAASATGAKRFVIAGGTDLYVQRGEEIPHADVDVLNHRQEWEYLRVQGDQVLVGGLTTFEAFAQDPQIQRMIPTIKADMELIASLPIRNRATLSGNLINASPIGDMTDLLLALGAHVTLEDAQGQRRELPLESLYLGYKTLAKRPEELVVELRFEVVQERDHISFEKVSKRRCLDIATVNSAARVRLSPDGRTVERARLALGGVAAVPLYLSQASQAMRGQPLDAALVQRVVEIAMTEISPISDVRGSADYKRLLARQLLMAHFIKLFPSQVPPHQLVAALGQPLIAPEVQP